MNPFDVNSAWAVEVPVITRSRNSAPDHDRAANVAGHVHCAPQTGFISSIAWPIVGILALLLFKGPIQSAVSGTSGGRPLRRVKAGNFEVEWEQLDKTEQEISDSEPTSKAKTDKNESSDTSAEEDGNASKTGNPLAGEDGVSDLYELAHQFPIAAILLAFKRANQKLYDTWRELETSAGPRNRDGKILPSVKRLKDAGYISEEAANGYRSLQNIRNQVTHTQNEEEVTPARAVQYLMIANDVLAAFSAATR